VPFKDHFRNSVLRPVDEDVEVDGRGSFLPARLAHLKGPLGVPAPPPATPGPAPMPPSTRAHAPTPSILALSPVAVAVAVAGRQPMLRGPAGKLLMGPWNGVFARAGSADMTDANASDGDLTTPAYAFKSNAARDDSGGGGGDGDLLPTCNRLTRDKDVADGEGLTKILNICFPLNPKP